MGRATGTGKVTLIAVGNSKGIRLPQASLQKYGWSDSLVLEERCLSVQPGEEQALLERHLSRYGRRQGRLERP